MCENIINQGLGLLILMCVNITLGSLSALFVNKFDIKKMLKGTAKSLIVIACFIATYFVGYLNPDILAININGVDMDIMTAMGVIILAGYFHYAKDVFVKLAVFIGAKFPESVGNKSSSSYDLDIDEK